MYITKKEFPIDPEHQSIEVPNSGGVRQSTLAPLGVTSEFEHEDTKTIVDILRRGCKESNNGPCLGWRDSDSDYKWLNYEEVIERSKNISYGLVNAGLKKGQESFVGIYCRNRVEWVLIEQALYLQSAVSVPLYDTLGPTACAFILNQVEAEFLVCDSSKKIKSILDSEEAIPNLRHIVAVEEVDEALKASAKEKGITIHQLSEIEDSGKQNPGSLMLPGPSDLAVICYTSGTTGNPKGVMQTHGNVVIKVCGFVKTASSFLSSEDVYFSYLPMAHVLDRATQIVLLMKGGRIGFFSGDIKRILEDVKVLKPTIFAAVPRILNRIFDKVQNEINSSVVKSLLMRTALRSKRAELERGLIRNNSMWDYFILNKVSNIFGGRLRMLVCGGAPIREEVLTFFKCSLGCIVSEVYGQTETTAATNCSVIGDYKGGNVGPPLICEMMKVEDVPDMGYYAKNGEGEILVKGPTVMKGYFKDPVRTAEVLDEDGWLHTGDIGRWMENGALSIIDRKKNILKLSQGEYVSPEKIESVYLACPYVEQIFVEGNSLENFLVAIIAPDKDELMSWCFQRGIKQDWNEICKNETVQKLFMEEMHKLDKAAGLKGFEQVKAIHLHPDGFSIQNGLLSSVMKVKRDVCRRQFKDVIEKMYQDVKAGKN